MAKKDSATREETLNTEDVLNNGTVNGSTSVDEFEISTEGFVDEQTGFPPYWSPVENGKEDANGHRLSDSKFKGVVINKDERDPEFVRYTLIASVPLRCKEGPSDEAKEVIVKPGQFFTCSAYSALPLDRYLGFEVIVIAQRKRPLNNKQDLWVFRLLVGKEDAKLLRDAEKKLLESARHQKNAELAEAEQRFSPPGPTA